MARVDRFEDLMAWQEARKLRKEVYAASKAGLFARDFEMRSQIRDAALSAMDNIAEGFERGSNKEFAQFLNISKGSAGEVRSALYAALDEGYLSDPSFAQLHARALSVARLCSKLITYLQTREKDSRKAAAMSPSTSSWSI